MSASTLLNQRKLRGVLPISLLGLLFVSACVDDQPGIADNANGGVKAAAGKASSAGSDSAPVGGDSADAGGAPSAGSATVQAGSSATMGGVGGGVTIEQGGTTTSDGGVGQVDGQAGQAGEGGAPTSPVAMACLFHTDVDAQQGAGGAPAATVVVQTNAFVGSYLTDSAGRTLYTYAADLPGDCKTAPKSTCVADCLTSWPIFDAGARVLGVGLNDAAFGSFDRGDGTWQTTYYGWPLYYYKSDLTLGQLTGQGKTWHAAELTPASVVMMKAGSAKYLADGAGHTLYVSSADQAGTLDADPVSACDQACLATFTPFNQRRLSVSTSLEEADFSVFVRGGAGGLQLAYKGMPLYSATTDLKSGDMTGLVSAGFTAALP